MSDAKRLADELLHEVACSGALMIDKRLDYVEVQIDAETWEEIQRWEESRLRECTCHPDDDPPVPCPQKYALRECREAGRARVPRELYDGAGVFVELGAHSGIRPEQAEAVLQAAIRLIRKNAAQQDAL